MMSPTRSTSSTPRSERLRLLGGHVCVSQGPARSAPLARLRARWTPRASAYPRLRPGRPSWPSTPAPPSAPVRGPLLRTRARQQPLDRLLHSFPNHVADHSDQTLPSRHRPPCPNLPIEQCATGSVWGDCRIPASPSAGQAMASGRAHRGAYKDNSECELCSEAVDGVDKVKDVRGEWYLSPAWHGASESFWSSRNAV